MSIDYFMTIESVGKDSHTDLEDLNTFGLLPLMKLTKIIDEQVETMEEPGCDPAVGTVMQLNRMIYSGLKDTERAICRLLDSYRNTKQDTAA